MTIFNDDYEQYALEPIYSTKKITIPYQEALLKRNSATEFIQPPHESTSAQADFPLTRIRAIVNNLTLRNQQQQSLSVIKEAGK